MPIGMTHADMKTAVLGHFGFLRFWGRGRRGLFPLYFKGLKAAENKKAPCYYKVTVPVDSSCQKCQKKDPDSGRREHAVTSTLERSNTMELSARERSALRKALTSHKRWADYKSVTGVDIASMGKDAIIGAAIALDIDIEAVKKTATISTATESENKMKERTINPSEVADLHERFHNVLFNLDAKERELCRDILTTINEKQNGYATDRQFKTISNIVSRAEKYGSTDTANTASATPAPALRAPSFDKNDAGKPIWDLVRGHAVEEIFDHIKPAIEKALSNVSTIKIEMTSNGVALGESTGHHHPSYATLCRALSCRGADGFYPNVWIAGPAGSGKTHAARSFAKAAGLEFYYNGALRDAFELLGYNDANGVYHTTAFREAYEKGAVYLHDECDGSDNAALLALNGALANGIASFPDRMVERHPDCRIIATGNTWGMGATSDYVGRSKIDAAFLDRFGVRLAWDYDTALEVSISGNADFARRVQAARERARSAGLKVLITPRASIAGAALIAAGFTHEESAALTYQANLSPEQVKIVEGR